MPRPNAVCVDSQLGAFRFDPARHEYWLGDQHLWSVTGILRDCKYIDARWYKDEDRRRGTYVHQATHFLLKGTLNWSKLKDEFLGYVLGAEKFIAEWNVKPVYIETPRYHPELLYAGTADLDCTVRDGIPAIIDFKTGPILPFVQLQTEAYDMLARAWGEPRRRRWAVRLHPEGDYSVGPEHKNWAQDEAVFRNLVATVRSRELYGVKRKTNESEEAGNGDIGD